ncbi:hypothetical protein CHS0354_029126 [Potamilus streckersoni]|uniref:Uncharacterized protein n=1 Tax=Potamilus streckersoni TaxID=2493646 RepID=A0AAE0SXV8_9BIVA|nr:hypothetical protein CHS0354_029126 [Potamilus streckersoni]
MTLVDSVGYLIRGSDMDAHSSEINVVIIILIESYFAMAVSGSMKVNVAYLATSIVPEKTVQWHQVLLERLEYKL